MVTTNENVKVVSDATDNGFEFRYYDRNINLIELLPQIYRPIKDFNAMTVVSGKELASLYEGVVKLLDNQFISTCDVETIGKWEKYFGIIPNSTDTLDDRKFRVLAKLNDSPPYTDRYLVQRLMELCGVNNFKITRDYGNYSLLIEISLNSTSKTETIKNIIRDIVPANINLTIREYRSRYTQVSQFTHDELSKYKHDEIKLGVMLAEEVVPIKITTQPADQTVGVNENAVFTVEAEGEGLTYQWQHMTTTGSTWLTTADSTSASGAQTAELTVKAQSYRNGYQYRCMVTGADGSVVYSEVATLTIE